MYKKIYRNMCFLSIVILILSAVMILSASYTTFNTKLKNEIKSETDVIAEFLNSSEDAVAKSKEIFTFAEDKSIAIFSPDGKVLFDTGNTALGSDPSKMPEVSEAAKGGFGEASRHFDSSSKKMYYYAVRLDDGSILRTATPTNNIFGIFIEVSVAVLFIAALIYILSAIVAGRLTDNILKPIEDVYALDSENIENVYEEIRPFLARIARQNNEIKRQINKVKEQKVRLQAITDNINEGLIIVDTSSVILSINACALEIFGKTEAIVINRDFSSLTENDEMKSALLHSLSGHKENIKLDIGEKSYHVFLSPVYENNSISGVVILIFDVSDTAKSELIRKEFTANVSHELKTPLTTIHGYAQIIGKGIARPEDVEGFAEKIEKESSRLITLIDDIIALSILDEGESGAKKDEINLKELALEVSETLSSRASEKNVSITVSGDDTKIIANRSQISELIYNLIDNAIKYNKDGGSVKVTIDAASLRVSDTGIGIPKDCIGRVFERFFRVDKSHSKKVNGTGLGLSIAKHAAEANNAKLSVESTLGEGSTFTIEFDRGDN